MRIALASSNGDIVDLHLGKAVSLVIYDVVDNDFDFVENIPLTSTHSLCLFMGA